MKIIKKEQAPNTRIAMGVILGLIGAALCYTVYGWFIDKSLGFSYADIEFTWGHIAGLIVGLLYLPFLLWIVLFKEPAVEFLIKVDREIKKVTWPSWDQLRNSVYVILGVIVFFSVVVFALDYLFFKAIWVGLLGLQ